MPGDKGFIKNKDDNSVENSDRMIEITNFFNQKITEFHGLDKNIKEGVYSKPYAKGFTDVDFGEALRESRMGKDERTISIFNKMIKNAILIDPSWPDIKLMQELVATLENKGKINKEINQ